MAGGGHCLWSGGGVTQCHLRGLIPSVIHCQYQSGQRRTHGGSDSESPLSGGTLSDYGGSDDSDGAASDNTGAHSGSDKHESTAGTQGVVHHSPLSAAPLSQTSQSDGASAPLPDSHSASDSLPNAPDSGVSSDTDSSTGYQSEVASTAHSTSAHRDWGGANNSDTGIAPGSECKYDSPLHRAVSDPSISMAPPEHRTITGGSDSDNDTFITAEQLAPHVPVYTRSSRLSRPTGTLPLRTVRVIRSSSRKQQGHGAMLWLVDAPADDWHSDSVSHASTPDFALLIMGDDISLMTHREAMASAESPQWRAAMAEELAALKAQSVATAVKPPLGKRVLSTLR